MPHKLISLLREKRRYDAAIRVDENNTLPVKKKSKPGKSSSHDELEDFFKPPSKTDYVRFRTHPVRGWLSIFSSGILEAQSLLEKENQEKQHIFDSGHEVGRFAQTLFPGGVEISFTPGENDPKKTKEQADRTLALLKKGETVIYEATFIHEGGLCHTDLFVEKNTFLSAVRRSGLSVREPWTSDLEPWTSNNEWILLEVKSGTRIFKENSQDELRIEKLDDAAFQYYIASHALAREKGGSIVGVYFAQPLPGFMKTSDENISPWDYFQFFDVTDCVLEEQSHVESEFKAFKTLIRDTPKPDLRYAPDFELGKWCMEPFGDSDPFLPIYLKKCGIPYSDDHGFSSTSIFSIAHMPFAQKAALFHGGVGVLSDLETTTPSDLPEPILNVLPKKYQSKKLFSEALLECLPPTYKQQVEAQLALPPLTSPITDTTDIDFQRLHTFFSQGTVSGTVLDGRGKKKIEFPIVAMDFETINRAISRYRGQKTWEQEIFQVSLVRIQSPDSRPEYGSLPATVSEFQTLLNKDNRSRFAQGLVSFIYNSAVPNAQKTTILAWNAAFERDRIKELLDAQLLTSGSLEETETQKGLKKILRNLVDLREPFSYRVIYSPLLRGGSSLKTVHPYMLPLSQVHYHDLEVKNGGMAAVTYHQIEKGDMLEQQAGEKMAHLIRYCNFDSESTLQIFCKLWFLYTAKRSLFTHEELASHHEMRKQLEF